MVLAAAAASAVPLELHVLVKPGESIDGTLRVDGRDACRVALEHDPSNYFQSGCRFQLVPGATIEIEGETWKTMDFAAVTAPLAESGDFGERFARYVAAVDAFGRKHFGDDWSGNLIETEAPATKAELDAAEQRLGQPLPAEYRQLLQRLGAVSVHDHNFSGADLVNTYDYMIADWGTPAALMESELSDATKELFRATALLFTEANDPNAGLLYRASDDACGGGAAYWFVSDDTIDEPKLLRTSAGACADFAEIVHWLVVERVTEQIQDNLPERTLLIDPLATGSRLTLSLDPPELEIHRVRPP